MLLWLWLPSDPQAPHAQVYIGERGRHVFKLVFHGESVSAAYDEGANAAVAAAQAVAKFEEYKLKEDGGYLGVMEDFGGMAGTLCVIGITSGGDKICASKAQKTKADRELCRLCAATARQRETERGRERQRGRETEGDIEAERQRGAATTHCTRTRVHTDWLACSNNVALDPFRFVQTCPSVRRSQSIVTSSPARQVRRRNSVRVPRFILKNDQFAKTGSGQT
jgi:hypothetical protein